MTINISLGVKGLQMRIRNLTIITACILGTLGNSKFAYAGQAPLSPDEIKFLKKLLAKNPSAVRKAVNPSSTSEINLKQSTSTAESAANTSGNAHVSPTSSGDQGTQPKPPSYTFLLQPSVPAAETDLEKKFPILIKTRQCDGLIILLRQDISDIGDASACPKPYDSGTTKGATFSLTNDWANHNQNISAQGLVSALYNWRLHSFEDPAAQPSSPNPGALQELFGASIGPYVSVNTVLNSATAKLKSNSEIYSYGALAAFRFGPPPRNQNFDMFNYFSFNVGGVENTLTNTSSFSAAARWSFQSDTLFAQKPIHLAPNENCPCIMFVPTFIAQYDSINSPNSLQFNNKTNSLRIGPQGELDLFPASSDPTSTTSSNSTSPFINFSRLSAAVSYHTAYETYSKRSLYYFQPSINYSFDTDQHLALSLKYQRGRDESSGTPINQIVLGLTGKL